MAPSLSKYEVGLVSRRVAASPVADCDGNRPGSLLPSDAGQTGRPTGRNNREREHESQ